ncbi:MAG: PilZ domain-containing protein [Chloracidobacterium sp.]|nr:PilZ domain-containing protein [Chloracidobacterium sp.]
MSIRDRRSGTERRASNRYSIEMDVEWEGAAGRQPGTVSDVSIEGCFVLSSGEINDGDPVKVFVPLADGMKVQFDGKVANHVYEIGFGVRFEQLTAAQRDVLIKIVRETEGS